MDFEFKYELKVNYKYREVRGQFTSLKCLSQRVGRALYQVSEEAATSNPAIHWTLAFVGTLRLIGRSEIKQRR
jgi:hypothetical protein